jgi:hypothetical protein
MHKEKKKIRESRVLAENVGKLKKIGHAQM